MYRLCLVIYSLLLFACSTDPAINLEQIEVDAKRGDRQAIEQLAELLSEQESSISDRVYKALVDSGSHAVPVLMPLIESGNRQVREYAIAALGTLKVRSAISSISQVLATPELERRYVAAWALGEIASDECVAPLIKALADSNSEVRRYSTRALIKLNRKAVEELIAYLDNAEGEGAAGAIRALGDIADKRALDVLLKQAGTSQRSEAFLALGKLRDPKAEKVLVDGLEDQDSVVRMNAAMALGPLGGDAAAKALQDRLEDEVHVVREWSARSLEMITGNPVMYRNSQDEYVRPYQVYH